MVRDTFQWIIFHTSMEVSFGRVLRVLFAFVVSISFSYNRRNHSAGKLHRERERLYGYYTPIEKVAEGASGF